MKEVWVNADPWRKALVNTALEAGRHFGHKINESIVEN